MMKKLVLQAIAISLLILPALNVSAQLRTPAPSPSAMVKQAVGLTDVTIEYSRPSVRDRNIFAENGLVPFGQIWRTGANQATKITFSEDVQVGGQDLKAGSYAILTKPDRHEWAVHFYPYESSGFGSYVEKTPAAVVNAKTHNTGHHVESFTISVENLTNNGATIDIAWDKTRVSVPLAVHTEKQVMAQFEKMEQGPSAGEYYAMGNYLFESGKDLQKALEYVQKATKSGNPAYWQLYREALILGELGRKSEAVSTARRSLELARQAGNQDYVRLNENAIAKWQ